MIEIPTYIVVAALSGYLCYLLVPLVKKYCLDKGYFDMPGPRKIHTIPTPRLGGIAIFTAYFLGLIPGILLLPETWNQDRWQIIGIFLGGCLIFAMGIYDDLKGLSPLKKLFWEIIAAGVVIAFGVRLEVLNIPFYKLITLGYWGIPLTLLWLVAITNTINLIDGLDGLAAGVSAVVALSFLVLSIILDLALPSLLAAGVIGVALAFLRYNYFPASIFMGDSGALFLGYMFGVISLYWPKSFATIVMFVPILALGVPIIEISSTFFRRLFSGQKVYVADQRHIFHFLLELGMTERVTVWLFYLVSFQFALAAFAIGGGNRNILFVLQTAFIIFTAIIISRNLKAGRAEKK